MEHKYNEKELMKYESHQSCENSCMKPAPKKCNVVHKYSVDVVKHYCNYHTHVVHHKVKKHKFIPNYTCSHEVVCHDEWC